MTVATSRRGFLRGAFAGEASARWHPSPRLLAAFAEVAFAEACTGGGVGDPPGELVVYRLERATRA